MARPDLERETRSTGGGGSTGGTGRETEYIDAVRGLSPPAPQIRRRSSPTEGTDASDKVGHVQRQRRAPILEKLARMEQDLALINQAKAEQQARLEAANAPVFSQPAPAPSPQPAAPPQDALPGNLIPGNQVPTGQPVAGGAGTGGIRDALASQDRTRRLRAQGRF